MVHISINTFVSARVSQSLLSTSKHLKEPDIVTYSDWIATQSSTFWCVAVVTVCVYFVVSRLDVTLENVTDYSNVVIQVVIETTDDVLFRHFVTSAGL